MDDARRGRGPGGGGASGAVRPTRHQHKKPCGAPGECLRQRGEGQAAGEASYARARSTSSGWKGGPGVWSNFDRDWFLFLFIKCLIEIAEQPDTYSDIIFDLNIISYFFKGKFQSFCVSYKVVIESV